MPRGGLLAPARAAADIARMSGPTDSLPLGGVLVGGQSRRFGSDKAMAHVGQHSMAALAVRTLREVADPVVLLGGNGALANRMALPSRADERPGRGPLSGIVSGLRWALELRRSGLLVLACDLPLVTSREMGAIVAAVRPGVDAVVADGQPLCGWYSTGALTAIEEALENGRYSVGELLEGLGVERVRLGADSDGGEVLLNVNTPDDLIEAVRLSMSEQDR
jgi:molybdopterin-guanine dinucleotide biosynthesis protein A